MSAGATVLRWRHRGTACPPFAAETWWASKPVVWRLGGEVLEQRPCPRCGSHVSAECLEMVVIEDDGTTRGATER